LSIFRQSVNKSRVSLKSDKDSATLHEDYVNFWASLAQFFLKGEMFRQKL